MGNLTWHEGRRVAMRLRPAVADLELQLAHYADERPRRSRSEVNCIAAASTPRHAPPGRHGEYHLVGSEGFDGSAAAKDRRRPSSAAESPLWLRPVTSSARHCLQRKPRMLPMPRLPFRGCVSSGASHLAPAGDQPRSSPSGYVRVVERPHALVSHALRAVTTASRSWSSRTGLSSVVVRPAPSAACRRIAASYCVRS